MNSAQTFSKIFFVALSIVTVCFDARNMSGSAVGLCEGLAVAVLLGFALDVTAEEDGICEGIDVSTLLGIELGTNVVCWLGELGVCDGYSLGASLGPSLGAELSNEFK